MGGGHFWRGAFGTLLGLALLAVVAGFAYQAGTHAAVGAAGGGEMRTYGWHGGGFFFFPFLFFPLGIFLFFGLMRMLFWGGPRHWSDGGYGPYRGGPAHLEEWHRHLHEQQGTPTSTAATTPPAAPAEPSDPNRPASS
jgi:hypothetical protein